MVRLNIKRGDKAAFIFETTTDKSLEDVSVEVAKIYNGILRVGRLADEVEMLAAHGIYKPPKAIGLTDEQVTEMKIVDEWTPKCFPSGGSVLKPDDIGRRTGNAPTEKMAEVLTKTCADARAAVSKKVAEANKNLTQGVIDEAIMTVKGAVMIVYPMGLPPYDEVRAVLEDTENLEGRQASQQVIPEDECQLWWAGKEMSRSKTLADYVGKNEKTKIVVKIQKKGGGAPVREPVVDEQTQKEMMAFAYKKQEELKKLEVADDDSFMNAAWADSNSLKRQLNGTGNISMGFGIRK